MIYARLRQFSYGSQISIYRKAGCMIAKYHTEGHVAVVNHALLTKKVGIEALHVSISGNGAKVTAMTSTPFKSIKCK
jgi:hypothetical protein